MPWYFIFIKEMHSLAAKALAIRLPWGFVHGASELSDWSRRLSR